MMHHVVNARVPVDQLSAPACSAKERGCNVRIVREIAEFESLRDYWQRWASHPNADMDAYASTVRPTSGARPLILVVYRNGVPDAMLLGRVDRSEVSAKFGYKTIIAPKLRRMVFIYGGLLGNESADVCESVAATIRQCLRGHEADVAFFNRLKVDSELYRVMTSSQRILARDLCPLVDTHRSMTLPQHPDSLFRSSSPKVRKNLRWQSRRMEKDHAGGLVLRCYQHPAELDDLFRDAEHIAKTTYQRGLGVGFTDAPSMRERLVLEASHGWLRAYVLYIEGKPVAFWIGKKYGATFYSDFMGYDAAFSKYSPGMYVVTRVLEEMCALPDGPQFVDFGLGDAQYKEVLADIEWQEASLYLFAPKLKSIAFNVFRSAIVLGHRATKGLLSRTALLRPAKKIWRRHVAHV